MAQEGIEVAVYDFKFLKPLDEELAREALSEHEYIITIEDGCIIGGFGSAIAEFATAFKMQNLIFRMGIPDKFIEHGSVAQLQAICHTDTESVVKAAKQILRSDSHVTTQKFD